MALPANPSQELSLPEIHPAAFVHPTARLGDNVIVGPQAFIDAEVTIGAGTTIGHGAHVGRWTRIGENNVIHPFAVVGHDPQDLGYRGEESWTIVGDGNIIREGCTIHRGYRAGTATTIGNDNFFMVNSHVGHNCVVGNHVILVNGALLGGHVEVEDRALVSGNCQVHQFVRIGAFALLRGGSSANKDIPPFCISDGISRLRAINVVGLRRNDFDAHRIRAVKEAFKLLFRSGLRLRQAMEKIETDRNITEDVRRMLEFIRASKRGVGSGRRSNLE
ncbi:MAG: acyl-ACP--UDP-N-acetylglucosamine O-acyltransferase [Desulfuromonadales bacterium]